MFGFLNPIKNISNHYCDCVKYAFEKLGISWVFPLADSNIERIFEFLINLKSCALTKEQKEIIILAKETAFRVKKEEGIVVGTIKYIAFILIETNIIYYNWEAVANENINTIKEVVEKHFWV